MMNKVLILQQHGLSISKYSVNRVRSDKNEHSLTLHLSFRMNIRTFRVTARI